MERVQSFRTSDKELFDDETKALKHELMIRIRGLMQGSGATLSGGRVTNANDAANLLAKQSEALAALMKTHTAAVAKAEKRKMAKG